MVDLKTISSVPITTFINQTETQNIWLVTVLQNDQFGRTKHIVRHEYILQKLLAKTLPFSFFNISSNQIIIHIK